MLAGLIARASINSLFLSVPAGHCRVVTLQQSDKLSKQSAALACINACGPARTELERDVPSIIRYDDCHAALATLGSARQSAQAPAAEPACPQQSLILEPCKSVSSGTHEECISVGASRGTKSVCHASSALFRFEPGTPLLMECAESVCHSQVAICIQSCSAVLRRGA